MSIIPLLQEAELKVSIRNVYKSGGVKEVLVMANEMAYCLELVFKTLKECIEKEEKK
jgi:hypothetical protein